MQSIAFVITLLLALSWTNAQNECGGLHIHESGELEYKASSTYDNNELCTWTIRSGLASTLRFTLLDDGFEASYDYLTIATFSDYDSPTLEAVAQLDAGDRAPIDVSGPMAFVTFQSDSSVTGRGFRLRFEPVNSTSSTSSSKALDDYVFTHISANPTAATEARYPVSGNYSAWEFVTYVITPPASQPQAYLLLEEIDVEESPNCANDALNIHNAYYGGVLQQASVCNEGWTGSTMYGSAGPFILVFKSNGNNQRGGFRGTWKQTIP